jgi:hypothetical protein
VTRGAIGAALAAAGLVASAAAPAPVQTLGGGGPKVLWPLGTGHEPLQIPNAYGQFQQYGGSTVDYHDGIDIAAAPGESVYALEAGTVMYVDGDHANPQGYAVAVESADRPGTGFYYVHLAPIEGAHWVGQAIAVDEVLGTTVAWEAAADYDHLHLSLVEKRMDFDELSELELPLLYTGTPLLRFASAADEVEPKVLELRFFKDKSTSEFVRAARDDDLHVSGAVDVVVRVEDGFLAPAAGEKPRPLIPYAVRLEILRATTGEISYRNELVLDGRLGRMYSVFAQTAYKTVGAASKGEYDDRVFYVVVTNDPPYEDDAWDTAQSGPGEYVVRVTAYDCSGREAFAEERVIVP